MDDIYTKLFVKVMDTINSTLKKAKIKEVDKVSILTNFTKYLFHCTLKTNINLGVLDKNQALEMILEDLKIIFPDQLHFVELPKKESMH